jgi:hypothetical protein
MSATTKPNLYYVLQGKPTKVHHNLGCRCLSEHGQGRHRSRGAGEACVRLLWRWRSLTETGLR